MRYSISHYTYKNIYSQRFYDTPGGIYKAAEGAPSAGLAARIDSGGDGGGDSGRGERATSGY